MRKQFDWYRYFGFYGFIWGGEIHEINPFDWEEEFPEVFEHGGFDAVIGNPPYVRQELLMNIKDYLKQHYDSFNGKADLYVYFFEKGISILRDDGIISYISSNKFLGNSSSFLSKEYLSNSLQKFFIFNIL